MQRYRRKKTVDDWMLPFHPETTPLHQDRYVARWFWQTFYIRKTNYGQSCCCFYQNDLLPKKNDQHLVLVMSGKDIRTGCTSQSTPTLLGDLLHFRGLDAIVQRCKCLTVKAHGLSQSIATTHPWVNPQSREGVNEGGCWGIYTNICTSCSSGGADDVVLKGWRGIRASGLGE